MKKYANNYYNYAYLSPQLQDVCIFCMIYTTESIVLALQLLFFFSVSQCHMMCVCVCVGACTDKHVYNPINAFYTFFAGALITA